MSQHRFLVLLLSLLLLLLGAPLARHLGPVGRIAFAVIFVGVLLSAVFAVSERRNQLVAAGIMAGIGMIERILSLFLRELLKKENVTLTLSGLVLEVVFFGFIVVLILKYVLTARRVTFNVICASLNAYLLLGVLWSQLYILIALSPELIPEFTESGFTGLLGGEEMGIFGKIDAIQLPAVYFSFVTLTTLGYGDITPTSDVARMVAIVEAIVGQFFLAVLVARLVGLHITAPRDESSG